MLTLAIYSQEGQLLAYNLSEQDTETFRQMGLIVKTIETSRVILWDEGEK